METWHPRAQRVEPADGHTGLSMIGCPWKIVLHTTETDAYTPSHGSYYGNPYWPAATIVGPGAALALNARIAAHANLVGDTLHLTWDEWRTLLLTGLDQGARADAAGITGPGTIYQHLPIDAGQYALAHEYGPETNRANAVQCEIVWRAANPDWSDGLLATVADWVGWVQAQTGVPTDFAEMWRAGVVLASVDSPIRFGDAEWLDFSGICGHSNVPGGNDHWDPGRVPVDRLRALLAPPAPPVPPPTPPEEDDDMASTILFNHGGAVWARFDDGSLLPFHQWSQAEALLTAKVPSIGDVDDEQFAILVASAPAPKTLAGAHRTAGRPAGS